MVICFDVIEHFTETDLLPIVDNVLRVLKPGGRWIAHACNGEASFFSAIRYGDITHEQTYTRLSIGQLVMASGFSKIRCHEDKPVLRGLMNAACWLLWKCIRTVLRFCLAVETGSTDREAIFSLNLLAVAVK